MYPKDKCFFCHRLLETLYHDLKCPDPKCYSTYYYKVITYDHNMIEFKIDNYWFEYYFGTEPDDRGMRVLQCHHRIPLSRKRDVIIDITEDKHYYANIDNYLEIVEKCKTLSLFD